MAKSVFLWYADEDKRLVNQCKDHLSWLVEKGFITLWDHSNINPGEEWEGRLEEYLNKAEIILLFISASFLASKQRYDIGMQQAITRHERKEASLIPIILRPVLWQEAPLDKVLEPLPEGGKAISRWTSRDDGFTNVAQGILKVVRQWDTNSLPDPIERRKMLVANLEQLIEAVKSEMQPTPRANATAATLQQLSVFIPTEVTLADLIVGWQTLSHPKGEEEPKIVQRRLTCGELARLAAPFTTEHGDLAQAIKTWSIWINVFAYKDKNDPRQKAMTETFTRELAELQAANH
jgi:hypothetical protein